MGRMVVAIEGPSGVGKSSLLPLVADALARGGHHFVPVSNVGSSALADLIREQASRSQPGVALCLALAAARAELLETCPGNLLFDRFVLSSLVYQPVSGVDVDFVYAVNAPLMGDVTTLLLEAGPPLLRERRRQRAAGPLDYFKRRLSAESEAVLFAQGARYLVARGHRVIRQQATGTAAEVATALAERVVGHWSRP